MRETELLVVLRSPAQAGRLSDRVEVLHQVSPTVLLVTLVPGDDPGGALEALDLRFAGTDPPADVLDDLDDNERLFVQGWLARRAARPADRVGEGLSWDAPGMEPPDLPRP